VPWEYPVDARGLLDLEVEVDTAGVDGGGSPIESAPGLWDSSCAGNERSIAEVPDGEGIAYAGLSLVGGVVGMPGNSPVLGIAGATGLCPLELDCVLAETALCLSLASRRGCDRSEAEPGSGPADDCGSCLSTAPRRAVSEPQREEMVHHRDLAPGQAASDACHRCGFRTWPWC
jgi:hypothetical protein